MRHLGFGRLGVAAALLAATPALAQDAAPAEPRSEIVVFGGASILDASASREMSLGMPAWMRERWPGLPAVTARAEASLGSSALFGARYSRYLKGRLALEADLSVAPSHDLEGRGEVCLNGRCLGGAELGGLAGAAGLAGLGGFRMPGRGPGDRELDFDGGPSRNVTAWHYGAGLAYDITGGDVRPMVVFGAGGVSYSGARESETDFVLRFGAGLKMYFGRVGGRVEVVDHLVVDHFVSGQAEHDIHATAGFLVRF